MYVHFLYFRFYIHMIPCVLYIYSYGFWSGFIWFLWHMQRYTHIILLYSSQLVTNAFLKNWSKISQAFVRGMQFGDNWSSTSIYYIYRDVQKVFGHYFLLYISYKTTFFKNIIPKSTLWWFFTNKGRIKCSFTL